MADGAGNAQRGRRRALDRAPGRDVEIASGARASERTASRGTQAAAAAAAPAAPHRPDRVRVEVLLDRQALEDLELIRRHRHGSESRSEVVRQAVMWLRAKEAGWLLGARRQQERRDREAVELEQARRMSRDERVRLSEEASVAAARDVISGMAT